MRRPTMQNIDFGSITIEKLLYTFVTQTGHRSQNKSFICSASFTSTNDKSNEGKCELGVYA